MNIQLLFRITGAALGIQLALGGLVTFGYIDWTAHTGWGIVLGALVLITLVFVLRMPSRPRRLVGITVGLGVDVVLQALLGFAAQDTGNNAISWVHFMNAYAILAMNLFALFITMAGARPQQTPPMAAMQ